MTIDAAEEKKKQSLGERLLMLRNESGLTQGELAERLAISRQSISKWEQNKALPDIEKLVILSDLYQVSLDYLIRGEEAKKISGAGGDGNNDKGEEKNGAVQAFSETGRKSVSENMDRNRNTFAKQTILFVCMLLSAGFCLYMMFFTCRLLFRHTFTKTGKTQELVAVDRIYEQYTRAEVSGATPEGDFYQELVWLDIPGVREGDFVYSYSDAEKNGQLSFEYYSGTLLLPMIFTVVFLMFFIAFAAELRGFRKGAENGEKKQ